MPSTSLALLLPSQDKSVVFFFFFFHVTALESIENVVPPSLFLGKTAGFLQQLLMGHDFCPLTSWSAFSAEVQVCQAPFHMWCSQMNTSFSEVLLPLSCTLLFICMQPKRTLIFPGSYIVLVILRSNCVSYRSLLVLFFNMNTCKMVLWCTCVVNF